MWYSLVPFRFLKGDREEDSFLGSISVFDVIMEGLYENRKRRKP